MRRTGLPYQKIGFFLFFASISLFCIYHLVTDDAYLSRMYLSRISEIIRTFVTLTILLSGI